MHTEPHELGKTCETGQSYGQRVVNQKQIQHTRGQIGRQAAVRFTR